jgi:hypothetical protein
LFAHLLWTYFTENFGFIITKQKAARLWLQIEFNSGSATEIENAFCVILSHPLPEVVQEACFYLLKATDGDSEEIHGNFHKLLGWQLKDINIPICNWLKDVGSIACAANLKRKEVTL